MNATPATGAPARPPESAPDVAHFDIADPLPGVGTTLLEASAGTGKTWTIAALVTRYVAEGVVTLPQMLVVTFGRAASQELRARVREQLLEAAAALADPPPAAARGPLEALLLDVVDDERVTRLRRVRTALADIDAATIATTHQFCQQVLRGLGVAGDTDPDTELVEDLDDLLVEVVDDLYLARFATQAEPAFSRAVALQIARDAVDDVHAAIRPTAAEPGSPSDRRARFAKAVRAELDVRKRRLRVMHYNDLLTQLAAALAPEDAPARARMRARWKVVLVDEFQDTDPVQWQVLDRAFTGHAAMVLIGDPKQAIYLFRGGDVVTYLEAAATADHRRTLPCNYRSDEPLVRSLDVMLRGAELGDPAIQVRAVEPYLTGSRLRGAPHPEPVRLRMVRKEHVRGPMRVGPIREHIATDLARDIAELLASGATFAQHGAGFDGDVGGDGAGGSGGDDHARPLLARDIAVVAHTNARLLEVQAALRAVGIHSVTTGGSNVLVSRAAHDWLALLEAMAAPHRRPLARVAALTALLGYSAAQLDAGGDALDDELAGQLRSLADVYTRQGIAAVFEALAVAGLPHRVLGLVGGERELTDVRHVAELLHEASDRGRVGLAGLITWLRAQMAKAGPQSAGARTRRLDSDATAVQLVTVHGSKGLQYPVVYLPTLWDRFTGTNDPPIARFHEAPPGRERCLDVGGPGGPFWSDAVARHRAEDCGESLRLLYVALTRAQSQVVLWWAGADRNTPASPLHRMLLGRRAEDPVVPDSAPLRPENDVGQWLARWQTAGALTLEDAVPAALTPVSEPARAPALAIGAFTRRIDHDWRRTSYTALSTPRDADGFEVGAPTGGVGSEPESVPRDDEPEAAVPVEGDTLPGLALAGVDVPSPMAALPVGATFGSLVHAVLEHADPQAPDLRGELLAHVTEQLVRWPVEEVAADPGTLADALVAVCESPLGPLASGVRLRDIGIGDRLCELDFELPLGGGDSRGVSAGESVEASVGAAAGASAPAAASASLAPGAAAGASLLGDLAPLLRAHLAAGDPVRGWADVLDAQPALAEQQLRGYLTGSVDVVLRTGGRYLVVDYKTNWLGPIGDPDAPLTAAAYRPEALVEAMGHSSYPLQALLYAVVAHRFLRWRLPGYEPKRHLGGVLYLYVRGMCGAGTPVIDGQPCGVFSWRPPPALVEAVSDLLDGGADREPAGRRGGES